MPDAAFECACGRCAQACGTKPGLFLPGQAEALAERLGMSFEELFSTRLAVDRIACEPHDILVLSPGIAGVAMGTELPPGQRGTCTFFDAGRCSVHAGKPHECAAATHTGGAALADIVNAWVPFQDELRSRVNLMSRPLPRSPDTCD